MTPLPFVEGKIDSGPAFLANGRLAFTSTRDGNYTTNVWYSTSLTRGMRLWSMDPDGRNVDLASHHSLSQEQGLSCRMVALSPRTEGLDELGRSGRPTPWWR